MLIVLHKSSFFVMSNDSCHMSFGASKTIVSYKHIKQPVQKHILFLGVNLFFNSTIHLMVHLLDSILNP